MLHLADTINTIKVCDEQVGRNIGHPI